MFGGSTSDLTAMTSPTFRETPQIDRSKNFQPLTPPTSVKVLDRFGSQPVPGSVGHSEIGSNADDFSGTVFPGLTWVRTKMEIHRGWT